MKTFRQELEELVNRHSMEQYSNTPDFVLAEYLLRQLEVFDLAVRERERWYGRLQGGQFWKLPGKTDPTTTP